LEKKEGIRFIGGGGRTIALVLSENGRTTREGLNWLMKRLKKEVA